MSGTQNSTKRILQPNNPFTTHLTIPTTHHYNTQQNQNQTEIPTSQYTTGESSNTNKQETKNQELPEFFVYPEGIIEEGVSSCTRSVIGKIITDKYPYTLVPFKMALKAFGGTTGFESPRN
jgi:hypothetical protein